MGADEAWKGDYRKLYGQLQRIHPKNPRAFEREVTRWRVIAEGLGEVMDCVPRSERRLYVVLAEAAAFAKFRHRTLLGGQAEEPLLFSER